MSVVMWLYIQVVEVAVLNSSCRVAVSFQFELLKLQLLIRVVEVTVVDLSKLELPIQVVELHLSIQVVEL